MRQKGLIKRTAAAFTAAVCAAGFTSCADTTVRTSIDIPEKITFSWWGNDTRSDYTMKGITLYKNYDPDIEITPQFGDFTGYKEILDTLFSSGKEADVMQINYSWLAEYSPDGEGFYDLNELSDYIALDNFTAQELSYGTVNGKLNAIPISLNAATFYYNKTLFDEYNMSIPKTWDDLLSCAEEFSKDGIYTLETSSVYTWLLLVAHEEQLTGKSAFCDYSEDVYFTEANVVSMMNFYKELLEAGVMPYGNVYDRSDFFDKTTAGELLWVSDAEYYVTPLTDTGCTVAIGDYILSDDFSRVGWYLKPTSLYAISKNTQNPEAAAKYLNFLLNNEEMAVLQGTEKGTPLSNSALETLEANNMLSGDSYEASKKISESGVVLNLMPQRMEEKERYEEFFAQFDLYYYGQKTIEEAAADFTAAYPFGEEQA